jgi:hypothetical protein
MCLISFVSVVGACVAVDARKMVTRDKCRRGLNMVVDGALKAAAFDSKK